MNGYCINCGESENVAMTSNTPSGERYECRECGEIFYATRESE